MQRSRARRAGLRQGIPIALQFKPSHVGGSLTSAKALFLQLSRELNTVKKLVPLLWKHCSTLSLGLATHHKTSSSSFPGLPDSSRKMAAPKQGLVGGDFSTWPHPHTGHHCLASLNRPPAPPQVFYFTPHGCKHRWRLPVHQQ